MKLNDTQARPVNGADKPEFTVPKHIIQHTLDMDPGDPVFWQIKDAALFLSKEERDDMFTIAQTSVHTDKHAVSPQDFPTITGIENGSRVEFYTWDEDSIRIDC